METELLEELFVPTEEVLTVPMRNGNMGVWVSMLPFLKFLPYL